MSSATRYPRKPRIALQILVAVQFVRSTKLFAVLPSQYCGLSTPFVITNRPFHAPPTQRSVAAPVYAAVRLMSVRVLPLSTYAAAMPTCTHNRPAAVRNGAMKRGSMLGAVKSWPSPGERVRNPSRMLMFNTFDHAPNGSSSGIASRITPRATLSTLTFMQATRH